MKCSPASSSVRGIFQATGMGCYILLQEIFPGPRIEPVSLVSPICNPPSQYSPCFHSRLWMCREWQNPAVCIPSEFVSALTSKVHSLHSLFFFFTQSVLMSNFSHLCNFSEGPSIFKTSCNYSVAALSVVTPLEKAGCALRWNYMC